MYAKYFYMKKSHTKDGQAEGMSAGNACDFSIYEEIAYNKQTSKSML